MVDNINSQSPVVKPKASSATQKSLRQNFQNLSSGKLAEAVKDSPVVVNVSATKNNGDVKKLLGNLNDAVKYSKQALSSLEELARSEGDELDQADPSEIKGFTGDLSQLREDIEGVLRALRQRAERAEVIRENITSAFSKIEDVENAQDHAKTTKARIAFDSLKALEAHGRDLTVDRVNRLLEGAEY